MFTRKVFNYLKNRFHIIKNDIITEKYYFNKNIVSKTLLIVKPEAIGDYILFRNFLSEIKTSERYKGYKITLCGNELWKEIALYYDSNSIDDFIWIKTNELYSEKYKRLIEKTIFNRGFEEVIYPSFSRTSHGDDLVLRSGAKMKITFRGDHRNIYDYLKVKNDKKYDWLIDIVDDLSFEFYRYHDFFSKLLSKKLSVVESKIFKNKPCENKIVICPGASAEWRRWDVENFHNIALYLLNNYNPNFKFYICGASNDLKLAESLCNLTPRIEYINLVGTQSLVEFTKFLSDSFLVLTNDSGPLHIAAACQVRVLGISNGNNYGRFVPYPKSFNNYVRTVFPEVLSQIENDREYIHKLQNEDSPYLISDIKPEHVISEMRLLLV